MTIQPMTALALCAATGLLPRVAAGQPTDAEVVAEAAAAHGRCQAGAVDEGLARLTALTDALGERERRLRPQLGMLAGHCLQLGARVEDALAAYDAAIALADPDTPVGAEARAEARRLREALVQQAFGDLAVRCGAGVERVRLVERDATADCPARWTELKAGPYRVEPLGAEGPLAPASTVTVTAGEEAAVALDGPPAPAPPVGTPWRFGGRVGLGIASIVGETQHLTVDGPGPSWRLAATAETPRFDGWLSGQIELGVRHSAMPFTDTGYATDGDLGPEDIELSWWQLHVDLLARACEPGRTWAICAAAGLGVGVVLHAEEQRAAEVVDPGLAGDAAHISARLGLEAEVPLSGWTPIVGLHGALSPWPGAIEFADTRLPQLRIWLDVGAVF